MEKKYIYPITKETDSKLNGLVGNLHVDGLSFTVTATIFGFIIAGSQVTLKDYLKRIDSDYDNVKIYLFIDNLECKDDKLNLYTLKFCMQELNDFPFNFIIGNALEAADHSDLDILTSIQDKTNHDLAYTLNNINIEANFWDYPIEYIVLRTTHAFEDDELINIVNRRKVIITDKLNNLERFYDFVNRNEKQLKNLKPYIVTDELKR